MVLPGPLYPAKQQLALSSTAPHVRLYTLHDWVPLHAGEGMTELYAALQPVLDGHSSYHQQQVEAEEEDAGSERPVQLAIMGLPNVASFPSPLPGPPLPPSPPILSGPSSLLVVAYLTS